MDGLSVALVDRNDVEADSKDTSGRTPLSRVALSTNLGWMPPSCAASNGHKAVVKLLVDGTTLKRLEG